MKILNSLLIAVLSLSFVTARAQTATAQVADPASYLKQQLAEIADLKEQIAIIKKKKEITKVVLAISAAAAVSGLIVSKVAYEGQSIVREVQRDLSITPSPARGVSVLTVGLTTAAAGGVAFAASGGYLIYLNAVQLKNIEQQINDIQAEINATLVQLVLNKQ